jgi:hypothetical protein
MFKVQAMDEKFFSSTLALFGTKLTLAKFYNFYSGFSG